MNKYATVFLIMEKNYNISSMDTYQMFKMQSIVKDKLNSYGIYDAKIGATLHCVQLSINLHNIYSIIARLQ